MSTSKPHSFHPEDGGSKVLRNVGDLPQHYAASQPRRLRLELIVSWFSGSHLVLSFSLLLMCHINGQCSHS